MRDAAAGAPIRPHSAHIRTGTVSCCHSVMALTRTGTATSRPPGDAPSPEKGVPTSSSGPSCCPGPRCCGRGRYASESCCDWPECVTSCGCTKARRPQSCRRLHLRSCQCDDESVVFLQDSLVDSDSSSIVGSVAT